MARCTLPEVVLTLGTVPTLTYETTGTQSLADSVDAAGQGCAFSLFPTSVEELLRVADAGEVMPPKSTWFEPKLASGLMVNLID